MMKKQKCGICGGELSPIAGGAFRCRFCKSTFREDSAPPAAPPPPVTPPPPPSPPPAPPSAVPPRAPSGSGVGVYERNIHAILEVSARFSGSTVVGSGVLIDAAGYAVTNAHVVMKDAIPCRDLVVMLASRRYTADIVYLGDPRRVDLALIKIREPLVGVTPATFADFPTVRNGEQVFVIGNSMGDGTCITSGIVSDRRRTVNGTPLLMTDCAINGGNSGGPIFNASGDVIGVVVSSRAPGNAASVEGMNYAIPSDLLEEFLCGKHVDTVVTGLGSCGLPARLATCSSCFAAVRIGADNACHCPKCGKKWAHNSAEPRAIPARSPCPRCGSWNAEIRDTGFLCRNCNYEDHNKR